MLMSIGIGPDYDAHHFYGRGWKRPRFFCFYWTIRVVPKEVLTTHQGDTGMSFTLIAPVKMRGERAKFHVRDDKTGEYLRDPETGRDFWYSRKEAAEVQKSSNEARKAA